MFIQIKELFSDTKDELETKVEELEETTSKLYTTKEKLHCTKEVGLYHSACHITMSFVIHIGVEEDRAS